MSAALCVCCVVISGASRPLIEFSTRIDDDIIRIPFCFGANRNRFESKMRFVIASAGPHVPQIKQSAKNRTISCEIMSSTATPTTTAATAMVMNEIHGFSSVLSFRIYSKLTFSNLPQRTQRSWSPRRAINVHYYYYYYFILRSFHARNIWCTRPHTEKR